MMSHVSNAAGQSGKISVYSELTAAKTEMFYSSFLAKSGSIR